MIKTNLDAASKIVATLPIDPLAKTSAQEVAASTSPTLKGTTPVFTHGKNLYISLDYHGKDDLEKSQLLTSIKRIFKNTFYNLSI